MTDLIAFCEVCWHPIEPGTGSVWVDEAAALVVQQQMEAWEASREEPISAAEILTYPAPVKWHATHNRCDDVDRPVYWIAVDRISSWRDLTEWTADLMGKRWIGFTTWSVVLRETAAGRGLLRPRAVAA